MEEMHLVELVLDIVRLVRLDKVDSVLGDEFIALQFVDLATAPA